MLMVILGTKKKDINTYGKDYLKILKIIMKKKIYEF